MGQPLNDNLPKKENCTEEEILELAKKELLRDIKCASIRAEQFGAHSWAKPQKYVPNRRFLKYMLYNIKKEYDREELPKILPKALLEIEHHASLQMLKKKTDEKINRKETKTLERNDKHSSLENYSRSPTDEYKRTIENFFKLEIDLNITKTSEHKHRQSKNLHSTEAPPIFSEDKHSISKESYKHSHTKKNLLGKEKSQPDNRHIPQEKNSQYSNEKVSVEKEYLHSTSTEKKHIYSNSDLKEQNQEYLDQSNDKEKPEKNVSLEKHLKPSEQKNSLDKEHRHSDFIEKKHKLSDGNYIFEAKRIRLSKERHSSEEKFKSAQEKHISEPKYAKHSDKKYFSRYKAHRPFDEKHNFNEKYKKFSHEEKYVYKDNQTSKMHKSKSSRELRTSEEKYYFKDKDILNERSYKYPYYPEEKYKYDKFKYLNEDSYKHSDKKYKSNYSLKLDSPELKKPKEELSSHEKSHSKRKKHKHIKSDKIKSSKSKSKKKHKDKKSP